MANLRIFFSGAGIYFVSNILSASVPFLLMPVLSRAVGPEEYGKIAIFGTIMAAIGGFTGLSLGGAASRHYFERNENSMGEYIGACIQILALTTGIAACAVFLMRHQISELSGFSGAWLMGAVIASGCTFITSIRLGQWIVRKEARAYAKFQISQSVLGMALSLFLVLVLGFESEGRIFPQIVIAVFFAVYSLYSLVKSGLLELASFNRAYLADALKYGLPLVPHTFGVFLLTVFDRFLIGSRMDLEQVGIYVVAFQISMMLGILADAVNKAYVPWLYERLTRNVIGELREVVRYSYAYFFVLLLLALVIGFFSNGAVTAIAGEKFRMGGAVLGYLIVGQAFSCMYGFVSNYIFYSKKTGMLSIVSISTGLINVGLMLYLIEDYGIIGVSISFCLSMILRFLVTWFVANALIPMPWFNPLSNKASQLSP